METSFKLHGFCGWHNHYAQGASYDIEAMASSLNTSLPLTAIDTTDTTCATTGSVTRLGKRGYACIVGSPKWGKSSLTEIAKQRGHAVALANAYRDCGSQLCKFISGPFTLVLSDPDNHRFLIATDRLSRFPVYYHQHTDGIVFASTPAAVLGTESIDGLIREESIYDYTYFHMVPSPVSIYSGIHKLQAGRLLEITPEKSKVISYWLPSFKESASAPTAVLSDKLKATLKSSVARAMEGEEHIGAFLSGGLDSSTVVGMMSELADNKAEAYSIGFAAEGYDEMEYARITASHFGVKLNEYYVTPEDVVEALPLIATSYDEPFGNSSALPAYFCAKLAKENGVNRLLAGDGGDELFAGNERYAKQNIFEKYQTIPSMLRRSIVEPVANSLSDKIPLASKAKSYIAQANIPLPDRLQSYNFLHRHQPSEIFADDFLAQVKTESPLELQREVYSRPSDATKLNRMLYLDWQFTLADNDLRKVSHMCALAGVDVVYPMLDDALLDFSISIPSRLKLKGNNLRRFYKQSLTGWLPDDTINKKKQGFGLPFGIWMQTHKPLQEMAYDNLLSLKQRHYFKGDFLDKLIKLHREGHAAYYGELMWILTILELWLQHHGKTDN